MALKTDFPQQKSFDWLKWLIVLILFVAGLVVNYYYSSLPWPLRLLGWLFLLGIMAGVASQTRQGKLAISFARESRIELRKVFWPTRQETMQTTLFVAAMVVILALILWGIDSVLMWLIGWLTGQRG
ncbi:MAG: protein translocase subunit [uncultured bacterium]|nr:MAG: protein translocase subunit [uncultured bacterium]